jgi:hypothetical protein
MKSSLILVISLLFVYACTSAQQSDSSRAPIPKAVPSQGSGVLISLKVFPALASLGRHNELTLYVTLNFRTSAGHPVNIYPFAWDAYTLTCLDVDLNRVPPVASRETAAMSMLGCTPRLSHLPVSLSEFPTAIDYRISRGEDWIYYIKDLPADFEGSLRFRLKYSFEGVESNESEFVANIVRTRDN